MKENVFTKGQKVWCRARVYLFLSNRSPMCGTVKYKLPKLINAIVSLFMENNTKTVFYCLKMEDGKSCFYPEDDITEIREAIRIAENLWGVNEDCTDPVQMSAHWDLVFWYHGMKRYAEGCI